MSLNLPIKNIHKKFIDAYQNGNIDFIKQVIEQGLIKRFTSELADSTIVDAGAKGNLEVIEYLLENASSSNSFSKHIPGIFKEACSNGQVNVVQYLVKQHPSVFVQREGFTKMHLGACYAARNGHTQVIEYLFNLNHHAFTPDMLKSGTLLSYACGEGNLDSVKFLFSHPQLSKHIDIHAAGDISFKSICESSNLEALRYFIFDLNIQKTEEITKYLSEYKDPLNQIKELFKVRELHQTLGEELANNNEGATPKKLKI